MHSVCVELRRRKESRPELSLGMEAFLWGSPELGTCAWNSFQAPVCAGGPGPPLSLSSLSRRDDVLMVCVAPRMSSRDRVRLTCHGTSGQTLYSSEE